MTWLDIGTETVVVLLAGQEADPYSGQDEDSWLVPPGSSFAVETLAPPEPRPVDENAQDARNSVTSGWTLYLPLTPDTPVSAYEAVIVRGVTYPVQGTPAVWDDVGVVVQVYRTVG